MTVDELRNIQKEANKRVKECYAKAGGKSQFPNVDPVFDGIASEEKFLQSDIKVGWVLKEPYDYWDENGYACGGGWSLVKDCFLKQSKTNWETITDKNGVQKVDEHWKNKVWQTISYVMNGFLQGKKWNDLPSIRDDHSLMNVLLGIAWINVCKLPAMTSSRDAKIKKGYKDIWKEAVDFQINNIGLDVIIFGKTFGCFADMFEINEPIYKDEEGWVRCYRHGDRYLIDTYHPGRKGQGYVDAVIGALSFIKNIKRPECKDAAIAEIKDYQSKCTLNKAVAF